VKNENDSTIYSSAISRRGLLRTAAIGAGAAALMPALTPGHAVATPQASSPSMRAFEFDETTIADL